MKIPTPLGRRNPNPCNVFRSSCVLRGVMLKRLLVLLTLAVVPGLPFQAQTPPPRSAVPPSQDPPRRWILVLDEPPVAEQMGTRGAMKSAEARYARERVLSSQARLRPAIEARHLRVTGSARNVLNALFVAGDAQDVETLRALPGIQAILPSLPVKRSGTKAWELTNTGMAWHLGGGLEKAGLGIKIGIVDSGIDHTHPAFQDNSLPETEKFCVGDECNYTNRKVIAARSYVRSLAFAGNPTWSRPDDVSPRDRVGHGTAVASLAAGAVHRTPLGTFAGIAPKAYVGNYKVFGSPGVNDITFTDVVIAALDDAANDGMDVVTLSLSFPAVFGPTDVAPAQCSGLDDGTPCDPWARVSQNFARLGVTLVAAAGNEGDLGLYLPATNSIRSPGTTPEVITVGATTNAHYLFQSVQVTGSNVPDYLQRIVGLFGNGPRPDTAITAQMGVVGTISGDPKACSPIAAGSLSGRIALIEAGNCQLRDKVANAQAAGAVAVVFYRASGDNFVFSPTSLAYTPIPLILIGHDDGIALRDFIGTNSGRDVIIEPAFDEYIDNYPDVIAYFSSIGPAIGTNAIKPEVVAPGTNMYVATQKFDQGGDMYDSTGYTAVQGTSFSVPLVAGAVALSRQLFPGLQCTFSVAGRDCVDALKSSIVNTANPYVYDVDPQTGEEIFASVAAMGAGKLDSAGAVSTLVTVAPSTLSFGALNLIQDRFPLQESLVFTNHSGTPARLSLRVEKWARDDKARISITPTDFTLGAYAESQPVAVRLQGTPPDPGRYEGVIVVEGAGTRFNIPFMYLVTDGIPYNIIPLRNFDFVGQADQRLSGGLLFKVVDRFGLPVPNVPLEYWRAVSGGGSVAGVYTVDGVPKTDRLGIAEAYEVYLGRTLGTQVFEAKVPNLDPIQFIGTARPVPLINNGGIKNAALVQGQTAAVAGAAPGSIIAIEGIGLSEFTLSAPGPSLPLALGGISVSFDNEARQEGFPGRILSVAPSRVQVQVPWELQGFPSSAVKVSLDGITNTDPQIVSITAASPAFWMKVDTDAAPQLIIDARDQGGSAIRSGNRAQRNSVITLRANGLGPVSTTPPSGEPAPEGSTPSATRPIQVSFDGVQAEVLSTALEPGTVGAYLVRTRVPAGIPAGNRLSQVVVTSGGAPSPAASLPVAQ